jgi:hypothetical protein
MFTQQKFHNPCGEGIGNRKVRQQAQALETTFWHFKKKT